MAYINRVPEENLLSLMSPNGSKPVKELDHLRPSFLNDKILALLQRPELRQDHLLEALRAGDALLVVQAVEGALHLEDLRPGNVALALPSGACYILPENIEATTQLILLPSKALD
jgi:hypothetical protein